MHVPGHLQGMHDFLGGGDSHLAAQHLLSKVAHTLASMPLFLLLQTDVNPSQATFPSAPHFSEQELEPCEGPTSWQVWPLSASPT